MAEHGSSDQRSNSHREPATYRQNGEEKELKAIRQAMRKEGGAGGVSGTGQALPHHGFGHEDTGAVALGTPVGGQAELPMPENGATYQAGGTHLNRLRQEATRKQRLSGSTVASGGRGWLDPAPGAPVRRG
ncbi:hypothetical protein [Dyella flagellata]|uniref:Uncharacterized protein n=1 Tax=Dyella flagellata TaxID=1867833 RepID=A0ABQ5X7R0_9GAMM|nr:hypothetical protein [Dyella flagellata]GLQ87644.1 hypothetical protein GCM10007898_12100 [Dyella flagellata]